MIFCHGHNGEDGLSRDFLGDPPHLVFCLDESTIIKDFGKDNEVGLFLNGLGDKMQGFLDILDFFVGGIELDDCGLHYILFLFQGLSVLLMALGVKIFVFEGGAPGDELRVRGKINAGHLCGIQQSQKINIRQGYLIRR